MSNSGLRRALSPKRSLRTSLDPQGSEGSGLHRLSFSGSRKRTRKQSKLQPKAGAADVDPQAFHEEWRITLQEEEIRLAELHALLEKEGVLRPQFDMYMQRRFLRARNHDVAKAKAMFMTHMQWRKEFGVDQLDQFVFQERDAMISLYPQGYHKMDKMGRPIYIQHLGQVNIKKIYEITTEERMLKFHVQEYERCIQYIMPACSKVAGKHIEQTFAILDVKGVGIKQVSNVKQMMGKLTTLDSNNYPEMLGKTCIINAPPGFNMMFGMIKPFLDVRTRAKVEVCPKDFLPSLLKWIEPENLPRYLGGTSDATLIDDAGPWNDPQIRAEIEEDMAHRDGSGNNSMSAHQESPQANQGSGQLFNGGGNFGRGSEAALFTRGPEGVLSAGGSEAAPFARGAQPVAVPTTAQRSSPFAAHSQHAPFDADSSQYVEANEFDDASEYDDATSRLGSMSMSSVYSSDDDPPPYGSTGSPGRVTDGAGTADVVLQGPNLGSGANRDALAAWKAGERIDERGHQQHPANVPPSALAGRPIIERVQALESKLPHLKQKLGLQNGNAYDRQTPQVQHTLVGRVEALEEALDVLITAQEQQLDNAIKDDGKTKCSQCCIIM
ncbi:hypothetical protein WJX77_009166 [Trebouxia sp. C0004]